MTYLLLFLLEWKVLIKFCNISNLLQLIRVTLNLLLEVLDTLRHTLGNLQIVLHLLHGSSDLRLFQSVLRQRLVRVLQFPDLLPLEIDLGHLAVVVGQLLVIIVVRRLLVLLQLVNWLLAFLLAIIWPVFCRIFLADRHGTWITLKLLHLLLTLALLLQLNHLLGDLRFLSLHRTSVRTLRLLLLLLRHHGDVV